ncbi:Histone-Lysine N-Methyltransferase Nsd3 [Manis pentadactyla]|nr:Histone-Lysine N-Methyltransferase Nsd3 [Manis pentadactyla]
MWNRAGPFPWWQCLEPPVVHLSATSLWTVHAADRLSLGWLSAIESSSDIKEDMEALLALERAEIIGRHRQVMPGWGG